MIIPTLITQGLISAGLVSEGLFAQARRDYLSFDGVASYGAFAEVPLVDNFELLISICYPATQTFNSTLLSGSDYRIQIRGVDSVLLVTYRNTTLTRVDLAFSNLVVTTGNCSLITLSRNGSELTATYNGNSQTITLPTEPLNFNTTTCAKNVSGIGDSDSFYGIIYDVIIKELGSIIRNYPMLAKGNDVQCDCINADGIQLITNGDFTNGVNDWAGSTSSGTVEDNWFKYTGSTNDVIYQSADWEAGKSYNVSFRVEQVVSGNRIRVQFQGDGYRTLETNLSAGYYNTILTPATKSGINIYFELGEFSIGGEFWITDISVKESTGMQLYNVDHATDWFTLNSGTFIGDNLVDNTSPSSVGDHWTYLGDTRWQYVGDGSYNTLSMLAAIDQPNDMRLTFNVESVSGVILVSEGGTEFFDTTGTKSFDLNKSTVTRQVFKRQSGLASCVISGIQIKELINP